RYERFNPLCFTLYRREDPHFLRSVKWGMNRLRARDGGCHLNCPTFQVLLVANEKSFGYESQTLFGLCICLLVSIILLEIVAQQTPFPLKSPLWNDILSISKG